MTRIYRKGIYPTANSTDITIDLARYDISYFHFNPLGLRGILPDNAGKGVYRGTISPVARIFTISLVMTAGWESPM